MSPLPNKRITNRVPMKRSPGANIRTNTPGNGTPQDKIISVTDKFGAPGIKKNQGSTIIKYDTLDLGQGLLPAVEYSFFLEAQTRKFPFTNLTDGKLGVGEAMAIQRMYFAISIIKLSNGAWLSSQSFDGFFATTGSPFDGAVFLIMISNSQVVKPTPVSSIRSPFNRMANFQEYVVFHFDTDLIIPSLLEFEVRLKAPIMTMSTSVTAEFKIGCYIEGTGAILAPRTTF